MEVHVVVFRTHEAGMDPYEIKGIFETRQMALEYLKKEYPSFVKQSNFLTDMWVDETQELIWFEIKSFET